ncbi:MAG: GNAT family N-acetyltransferase [Candidatus Bathyarchaeia archaeon]
MRKIKIRLLNTKSRNDLIGYVKVHNEGYSTESWFGVLQNAVSMEEAKKMNYDATFLAEIGDKPVGLVDVKLRKNGAHIENLVVLKTFRRRGVGTTLLMTAEDFARKKGLKIILAETPIEAESANMFYKKAGYKIEGQAYLIKTIEPLEELHMNVSAYEVKSGIYWIPAEKDFSLIKQQELKIKLLGIFNVWKKEL